MRSLQSSIAPVFRERYIAILRELVSAETERLRLLKEQQAQGMVAIGDCHSVGYLIGQTQSNVRSHEAMIVELQRSS